MELKLPIEISRGYSSVSQQIRVMTETWVSRFIFCPNCGNNLCNFEKNKPVADFFCSRCLEEYELKAKKEKFGKKIVDGAYDSMIGRLNAYNNPNFFFLAYENTSLEVKNFLAIPNYLFTPGIIEIRKPLNPTARRAGWVGCNIIMEDIPEFGKIYYVQNGVMKNKNDVLNRWSKTSFLKNTHDIEIKGWLLDVLVCVEKIKKKEFSLEEMYVYESYLKAKHPANNNIQAKIRQQLQFLRDKNILEFVGRGKYRMTNDFS